MKLDVLSLAFIDRKYSYKRYDNSEFGMKDCLTTSSLRWELRMSLGQDEPFYTHSHQNTRYFIRETCYGGRTGANLQKFNSSL